MRQETSYGHCTDILKICLLHFVAGGFCSPLPLTTLLVRLVVSFVLFCLLNSYESPLPWGLLNDEGLRPWVFTQPLHKGKGLTVSAKLLSLWVRNGILHISRYSRTKIVAGKPSLNAASSIPLILQLLTSPTAAMEGLWAVSADFFLHVISCSWCLISHTFEGTWHVPL